MTNTHRKTTNRTTAKIAAVGALGIGAAIAFPGLASAQTDAPTDPTASLAEATGEDGSLQGALGTDIELDAGSLALNVNLDAEAPNPGSVEFGSLGVSPNTGSALIDGDSPSGTTADEEDGADEGASSGSLDLGSLTDSLAGLSSGAEETDDTTDDTTGETDETTGTDDTTDTTGTAGVTADVTADAGLGLGSLG